jgi:hypothetical protein
MPDVTLFQKKKKKAQHMAVDRCAAIIICSGYFI